MKLRFRRSAAESMRIAIYLTEVLPFASRLPRPHRAAPRLEEFKKRYGL
jgi:hypothetical protein